LRKYISDSSHVVPDLPKVVLEGTLFAEPETILKVDMQHLWNKSFRRLLIKWKDYLEDEAFGEREIDFRKDYSSFVIKDND